MEEAAEGTGGKLLIKNTPTGKRGCQGNTKDTQRRIGGGPTAQGGSGDRGAKSGQWQEAGSQSTLH